MTTTQQPNESLPVGTPDAAGKPATGKTSAKPSTKTTTHTKTSPLNPEWTKEVLEAAGFPTAIAEALAPAVSVTMNEDIQRKYTAAKVSRFAQKAFGTLCKK